ncbi:DNA-directed RNA polymerase mitochondrial precursor [Westerdykella ornata]|uniref:DNA-directed RNA polymerase n=1 Tax=Westerdykella ornata TaxID=318751 RepID=A0A6A6J9W2_WESOR|nr:DNA-directed RNA polymerase mitochondrial precursor [Westerdykella ornata]KAF2272963.1 DNA-directed RNA polymerase mitochondrial precursor [Westerdykella ornata]
MRWAARIATSKSNPSSNTRQPHHVPASVASRRRTVRSLATATEFASATAPAFAFEGLSRAFATRQPDAELAKLLPWDTSRPLVLDEFPAMNAIPVTPIKYGIGGDPVELHQNLYACLRVGRMDRASAILHRLTMMYNPSAPDLIEAHNLYLQAMFELAEQTPSERGMREIEEFYETQMVAKGIEHNAQTLVTLLRAAMNLLPEGMREASIQKYLHLARRSGPVILEDVNGSPEFSDEEWDTLIRLQSDHFEEPPPIETADPLQINTPDGLARALQHGVVPETLTSIKPVEQKGLGLSTLKQALSLFEPGKDIPYPHEMEASKEEKDRAYAFMRQIRTEQDAIHAATERWKAEDLKLQEMGIHGVLQWKPIQALMWNWYTALVPKLEAEVKKAKEVLSNPCEENMRDDRYLYGTYLELIPIKKVAALSITRLLSSMAGGIRDDIHALKLSALTTSLGMEIEETYHADSKERHESFVKKMRTQARREMLQQLSKEKTATDAEARPTEPHPHLSDSYQRKDFPSAIRVRLGALVLDHLIQSATITVSREDPKSGKQLTRTQPAFHHHIVFAQGKKTAFIVPHEEIVKKLRSEPVNDIQTVRLPMLVEPRPWTAIDEGGYYTIKEKAVRIKIRDRSQHAYTVSAIENGDMKQVLAGLDTLGKVPWKINKDVYKVMAECWNAGEGIAGLVPEDANLRRPVEPAPTATFADRMKYLNQVREYENLKSGLHSRRCFQNFQLEIARAFLNEEKIFYPHSVDFRGRAYPIPPILNHIGSDLSRGLLLFANGKELGEAGLQWLKVHLANLYGYDKASLKEREQFAMDNIEEIYDSANNPLNGNRWWTKADDPWQCLACCIELRNALESADPTRYVSHLPVHQDGTCNGLQHYAALGGDEAGASQVNLEPADKPKDIYTGVAEIVKELVAEDAKQGGVIPNFLNGKITRSVVKRTVMTNVYGVTFVGAKQQVLEELKTMFPDFQGQIGMQDLGAPATYIAKKIFIALGRIFNGAQEIQCWLGECGDRITSSISAEQIQKIKMRYEGQPAGYDAKYKHPKTKSERMSKKFDKDLDTFKTSIIWTTPLKMPVVQHYRKDHTKTVKTGKANITIAAASKTGEVNKRKQLQAFPPNFIHSLDATHMILSALKCAEVGIDFAAVHDSFWTHAADVENLNIVLRDAFVRMHSEDIVGRLAAEFKARYAGAMYLATLNPKSTAAAEIRRWRQTHREFQASSSKRSLKGIEASFTEVALEAQRQELLKSEDPEQRKKGEEMVTPTSIWLKYGDTKSLSSPRLALLGEMKVANGRSKAQEVKEKILEKEAETIPEVAESVGVKPVAKEEAVEGEAVEEPVEEPVEEEEAAEEEAGEELLADEGKEERPAKKLKIKSNFVKVWLPLTFPPVPEKGSWDVARLRESKYFFS